VIEALAARAGWHLETVIAPISELTDFKGMPIEEDGRTWFAAPDWAHAMVAHSGGLVFFDEISTAPPAVQAALLRPVLSRVVGSLAMPADTRFAAAANPPEGAADGLELSAPLANRFVHLEWHAGPDVVAQGIMHGFEVPATPLLEPDSWQRARVVARAQVGGFLMRRADLVHVQPESPGEAGRAWPSPRPWEMAVELLAAAEAVGARSPVLHILLAGAVGAPAAREFLGWRSRLDLPDVEDMLAGQRIDLPAAPERLAVLLAALAAAAAGNPSKQRCERAMNGVLVAAFEQGGADLATVALRRMGDSIRQSGAEMSPEAAAHFGAMLVALGRRAA